MGHKHGSRASANSYKSKTKECADCPAKIPAIGGRDRCHACADARSDEMKRQRGMRARAAKRDAQINAS